MPPQPLRAQAFRTVGISDCTSFKDGVPIKVVSERLGHASATFTMNTYQWLLPGMQAEAAAAFQRILATPELAEPDEHASNQGE